MGWEARRNGKRYYYEKKRQGNKVVSRYIGAGRLAPLVAEINQLDRERRQLERWEAKIARNEFTELAATPEAIILLLEQAQSEAARALIAAGYHQNNRGKWRKKRATSKNQDQDKSATS